ncbi:GlmL-related ornithine degradation protein [Athalassotoga sp.]|uniref:GlmL-related ornithine degradation protein n=1 Tax=Athalassotoga sp. TaxID=2022597 RepID=UPI003D0520A6
MNLDILTVEVGSTTTVLSGFVGIGDRPKLFVQGEHYTTVNEGDVTIGIEKALESIEKKIGEKVSWSKMIVSSSAAGGLKMTVHGLVYSMTVRAAREAALGAGAIVVFATSGKISAETIDEVKKISPKLILLSGGVDNGESETALYNAEIFAKSDLNLPFVYAGNVAVASKVENIFKASGKEIIVTQNVYPKVDLLNVEPVRKIIQDVFAKHIIHGPGMSKLDGKVTGKIIPTPAAVMSAVEILQKEMGDALAIDIGGATTDVDSITNGSPEIQKILISPEPFAKRTVEGDLGVFVNAKNVVQNFEWIRNEFLDHQALLDRITPYPQDERMEKFIKTLSLACASESIIRHAGQKRYLYGPTGRVEIAEGKDLTAVRNIFGTGGVLSRSKLNVEILNEIKNISKKHPMALLPRPEAKLYVDSNYIFAACGLISQIDPESAKKLLMEDVKSVG